MSKAISFRWLATWPGWLALIIALRLSLGLLGPEVKSTSTITGETLLNSLKNSKQEQQQLILDTLYQLAARYPEQRERIRTAFEQHSSEFPQSREFLTRLQNNPELVLQRALEASRFPTAKYLAQVSLWGNLALALVLVFALPLLLTWLVNKKSLSKILGRYGWQKVLLFNIALWAIGSCLWIFLSSKIWLQGLLAFSSCIAFYAMKRSKTLEVFLGINSQQVRKTFSMFVLILSISFLPYLYQTPSQSNPIATSDLQDAIVRAGAGEERRVVPLLTALIAKPNSYPPEVIESAIKTLGKIGNQEVLVNLAAFLHHPTEKLRIAALQAMRDILQHSSAVDNKQKSSASGTYKALKY